MTEGKAITDTASLFESIEGLGKLISFLVKARQPRQQTFFFTNSEMKRVDKFFKNLGSSGVVSVALPGTAIGCMKICYGGFDFNLVNIENHELIMEEMKINKGDILMFRYQSNLESIDKKFFIKEVGINEFIGIELGTSNKITFEFFKDSTKKH